MLTTDTNIDIWYREYREQWKKSYNYALRTGAVLNKNIDKRPVPKEDFKTDLISLSYDKPKMSGRQIAISMAKNDVYATSGSRASNYARAAIDKYGLDPKMEIELTRQYRLGFQPKGVPDIFSDIKKRRAKLFEDGKSKQEVWETISEEFFGSE